MKVNHLRWWIISLVAVATIINYIDRSALAIMWPEISKDLGLTKHDYANIITVFMVAYAIGQSVFGRLFDAIGTRFGFLLSITVWSISIALHSLASTALSFSIFRALLGFGEAGNWPGATKANAEWFPVKERALAQGIFNAGASVGSILAPPLIAVLYVYIGWKASFLVIGCVGLLWIIPWLILYRAGPDAHPWITEEEKQFILTGQRSESAKTEAVMPTLPLKQVLSYKQTWGIIGARFFIDPIWWLFVAWLPLYLNEKFAFDIKQIGAFAWVPYVGAAIGALFGGWLNGKLLNAGWSVNKSRKTTIALGCFIMLPALLLTSVAATPTIALGLIALILFGFQTSIGTIQTLPSDYFSGGNVGTIAGISGCAAVLSVILTIQVVPVMTQNGNYAPLFILGACLVPCALIAVWFAGKVNPISYKKS